MNTLFMIGNGFDKNLGLKTSYSEFYQYYLGIPSNNEIIIRFKQEIKKQQITDWADLELALGAYSVKFDNEKDYIFLINDVSRKLKAYLEKEQNSYNYDVGFEFVKDELNNYHKHLSKANQEFRMKFIKKETNENFNNINIINFNYTVTVDKIINRSLPLQFQFSNNNKYINTYVRELINVHGKLNDSMILGVNDETQIKNDKLRTEKVKNYIVKPTMNINAETLREKECEKLISEANIVVIYGMSIGETDKCWWELLMKKFLEDPSMLIIIVNYDSEYDPSFKHFFVEKKDELKNKLIKYLIKDNYENHKIAKERILVEFNTNMFKFNVKKDKNVA